MLPDGATCRLTATLVCYSALTVATIGSCPPPARPPARPPENAHQITSAAHEHVRRMASLGRIGMLYAASACCYPRAQVHGVHVRRDAVAHAVPPADEQARQRGDLFIAPQSHAANTTLAWQPIPLAAWHRAGGVVFPFQPRSKLPWQQGHARHSPCRPPILLHPIANARARMHACTTVRRGTKLGSAGRQRRCGVRCPKVLCARRC